MLRQAHAQGLKDRRKWPHTFELGEVDGIGHCAHPEASVAVYGAVVAHLAFIFGRIGVETSYVSAFRCFLVHQAEPVFGTAKPNVIIVKEVDSFAGEQLDVGLRKGAWIADWGRSMRSGITLCDDGPLVRLTVWSSSFPISMKLRVSVNES